MPDRPLTLPELMAPAGDWDCARAAVENGADALYFGLQGGLNARGRAVNFALDDLPQLMAFLRTRGVRGYLALNTLAFSDELAEAEQMAWAAVAAGVDAVLVQDFGLARLIGRLCPELPLHASTQMTLGSTECIAEAASLGIRRVVLPRELSLEEIGVIRRQTDIELEVFVHGALCITYSGQCLASLAMGGRSGNRGQCAQPCRLPYEVICDEQSLASTKPRPVVAPSAGATTGRGFAGRYPLSPHDLAAHDRLPELIAVGVSALKIEGRLKSAEYVAAVTGHYRAALDAAAQSLPPPTDMLADMETAFSRGFCHGWLDGDRPHALVSGRDSAKRGTYLGEVRGVRAGRIAVELAAPLQRGDGIVFEGDRSQAAEQGGRVYEVFVGRKSVTDPVSHGVVELAFRYGAIEPAEIHLGQKVWKTDDPRAGRRLRASFAGRRRRRVPLDLSIAAAVGAPLRVVATAATGIACRFESPEPLAEAIRHPLTVETLREQFGRLGNTPYELRNLEARIEGDPMVPLSVLGQLRRALIDRLDAALEPPRRTLPESSALDALRAESFIGRAVPASGLVGRAHPTIISPPSFHVLCRLPEQVEAALDCRPAGVILDFHAGERCDDAIVAARSAGVPVMLATPRIHVPGRNEAFDAITGCKPDGVLVRNLAGLAFFRRLGSPVVTDFSLHAANDLAVRWLRARGAERITAAYDLNPRRLLDLASSVPAEWLEVVIRRHTPMFHTRHCLFCATYSSGNDRSDCGRPCLGHTLRLRDRKGVEHPVAVDARCHSTVFHGQPESLADAVPALRQRSVRHFRVELLGETSADEIRRVMAHFKRCDSAGAASGGTP